MSECPHCHRECGDYRGPQSNAAQRGHDEEITALLAATEDATHPYIQDLGVAIRQLRADLAEATAILRAILAADERGQGQPFGEAMDRARAFVEGRDDLRRARAPLGRNAGAVGA